MSEPAANDQRFSPGVELTTETPPARLYVHPKSREWAQGFIEGKGWTVELVTDYHCERRKLYKSPPCWPRHEHDLAAIEEARRAAELTPEDLIA